MNKSKMILAKGLCLLAFAGTVISCKKDAETIYKEVPAPANDGITRSAILSSTTWETSKVTDQNGVDQSTGAGANTVGVAAFRANGTFDIDRNGDQAPDFYGTWYLSPDGTKRILIAPNFNTTAVVDVVEVTPQKFVYVSRITTGANAGLILTVEHEPTTKVVNPPVPAAR